MGRTCENCEYGHFVLNINVGLCALPDVVFADNGDVEYSTSQKRITRSTSCHEFKEKEGKDND